MHMYRYKGRQDDSIILVDSTKRNGHLFSIKSRVLDFEIKRDLILCQCSWPHYSKELINSNIIYLDWSSYSV